MSDRLQPEAEAKARIQALAEADFMSFFDELPVNATQRVARHLPKMDGFRPTSSAGIARQKSALARKLSRPSATDRDFQNLYLFWREWIYATFKNSSTVQELIDQIEEAAEAAPDEPTRRLAIENKVDALFAKLSEDSRQNLCTREQIERLLTFSPLPQTSTARSLIAAAKGASDVDHDTKFTELPERIQRAEGDIKNTAAELKVTTERIDQNTRSIAQALSDVGELKAATAQFKQDVERLRADVQQYSAGLSQLRQEVSAKDKAYETRFKSFSSEISDVRAAIDALRAQAPDMGRIDEAIAKLSASTAELSDRDRASNGLIARLQIDLDNLTRDLIAFTDVRTLSGKLVSLMARVAELETKANRPAPAESRAPSTQVVSYEPAARRATLPWERIRLKPGAPPAAIETAQQLASAFSSTLQSVGLRKQAAEVFAEECASAVVARQAIFLKGAFATHVARVLAASLAGSSLVQLAIPLGMESDSSLRRSIEEAFTDVKTVGALVIEGVDTVPIQMLRDTIGDCLTASRGVSSRPRIAIFGTLAEGVASIPTESAHLALGPIFDLDVLDWRLNYSGDTVIAANTLDPTADQKLWESLAKETVDTEEVSRLARLFAPRRNPAIDSALLRAYRALHVLRRRSTAAPPLQSLFYGWLLPFWGTLNLSRDQVDEHLDGGKVNGAEIDPRLKLLLADFAEEGDRRD
jgi:cytochrome c556